MGTIVDSSLQPFSPEEPLRPHDTGKKEAPPVDIPPCRYDLRILQSLRRIIRAVDIHSRKLVARHKVTGPQLVCLGAIAEECPTTATRIARQVFLSTSTVVGIIDRLQDKGLVRRERDSKDRRIVYVTATEEGLALIAQAPSPLQDTFTEALGNLPEKDQQTLTLSLEQIVDLLEAKGLPAAPVLETGRINKTGEPGIGEAGEPNG